jgi:hypothetical protein
MDRDNDGTLNWQDSYMDDPWNGAGDPNSWRVNGSGHRSRGDTSAAPGIRSGTLDSDNDGILITRILSLGAATLTMAPNTVVSWSDQDWDGIPDGGRSLSQWQLLLQWQWNTAVSG